MGQFFVWWPTYLTLLPRSDIILGSQAPERLAIAAQCVTENEHTRNNDYVSIGLSSPTTI